MRKLIVLAATLALASLLFLASQGQQQLNTFAQWQKDFNLILDLSPSELAYRQRVFEENLKKIEAHNALPGKTYQMGVNQFTAYTQAEFEAIFLSKMEVAKIASLEEVEQKVGINIDWVNAGAVSPVKNQGSCGATYAFSAIGGIEGLAYVTYKTQTEYSVQQLIDCSQSYGNSGCNSGNMVNSYNYIKAKGIQTEVAYPFTGVVGACKFSSGLFKISGAINVGTCTALESALLTRPVPVAVDGQNFASYRSGIFDNCGRSHSLAALLVGATDQYYRVKNSWGTTWGEAGYIRLSRTNNICGICDYATYPLA